jgi:uncharacterized radical SAM superfamily protein
MSRDCFAELETQNEGIDCDGDFTSENCIVLESAIPYLGLPVGSKLSLALKEIVKAIKEANTRIDNRVNVNMIPTYNDNSSAVAGGLLVGHLYKTLDGTIKAVINI